MDAQKTQGLTFDYTILYVADVQKSVTFYEQAFGLTTRLLHDSLSYAEMDSGTDSSEHTLAFADYSFIQNMLPVDIRQNMPEASAPAFQISFRAHNVSEAYQQALTTGAAAVMPPERKPWGQEVAFVRDLDGILIEICGVVANTCQSAD